MLLKEDRSVVITPEKLRTCYYVYSVLPNKVMRSQILYPTLTVNNEFIMNLLLRLNGIFLDVSELYCIPDGSTSFGTEN